MDDGRSKTGWRRAALLLGGILAGGVIGEIASHVVWGTCTLRIRTAVASERDFDGRRGSSREDDGARCTFDADGFRAEGDPAEFDRKVLFVGDSFTQGYGVADGESFPAQTGRALARRGIKVRALNAGNSGAGAAQELRLLRRLLGQMKVDALVLQVFPHNDLDDNWQDGGFAVAEGQLVEWSPPRPPPHIVWGHWLAEQGDLIQLNAVRLFANAFPRSTPNLWRRRPMPLISSAFSCAKRWPPRSLQGCRSSSLSPPSSTSATTRRRSVRNTPMSGCSRWSRASAFRR